MTLQAICGATALIMRDQLRASLLPCWSIVHAALWHSSRAWSISLRDFATCCCTTPCSASGLPNAMRVLHPVDHQRHRPLGHADRAHAVVDAARAQPGLGDREAAALLAQQIRHRHPDVVEA